MNTPLRRLGVVIALMFASLLISTSYVQFVDAGSLNTQPTNSRTLYKEFGRDRGPLLVDGRPVAESVPSDDQYGYLRRYPGGETYATVTGYYSVVYGTAGLESSQNSLLSGTSDQLFYRRLGDLLTGREPKGASVELTIDPRAQEAAWEALGDRRGAVVALDPSTGDVLAMVSRPSYDPDDLAAHEGVAVRRAWKGLSGDGDRPLNNRATTELYPPGSVFKLVTAAAALSSGDVRPDSRLPGPAVLDLPQTSAGLRNDNGRACGDGTISLADALRVSCNTAFASLGLDLGQQALRDQAEKFGFGTRPELQLRTVASVFPPELDQPQLAQSSIGQRDVQVTPLQMAMVSAGIANGGVVMRPNLIRKVQTADAKLIEQPRPERLSEAVSRDVAEQLTSMMVGVVRSGTGVNAQISGVEVAGKTGTAQQGDNEPPHAWFTSFAPAGDPQVAVAVVIEDGGGLGDAASGGRLAAPVARAVMQAVIGR